MQLVAGAPLVWEQDGYYVLNKKTTLKAGLKFFRQLSNFEKCLSRSSAKSASSASPSTPWEIVKNPWQIVNESLFSVESWKQETFLPGNDCWQL